jgi:hypothetical protein
VAKAYKFLENGIEISFFDENIENSCSILISAADDICIEEKDKNGTDRKIYITDKEGFYLLKDFLNKHP